jgi:hypothetical protein
MYTLRGVDDAELQRRITATLPTLQEVIEACEERAAQRAAAREAAQAAQAQQAPASAPADLQALLQQAVQQALASATGQAPSTPPPAAPSTPQRQAKPKTGDQATGVCSLHNVGMEHHDNERGSWYSHWLPEDERHCKGRR